MAPHSKRNWLHTLTLTARDYVMVVLGSLAAIIIFGVIMIVHDRQTPIPYQPAGVTAAWIPVTVRHWDTPISAMAKKYDIDANLIAILMTMESGGDAQAKSEAGAIGLMQVTPLTAGDIAAKYLKKPVTKYDLTDPATNIEFGTAYLAWLRSEFGTMQQGPDFTRTVELIATGYNGGAGTANALEQGEGLRDTQPVIYSRDAFNMWRERVSAKSPTYDRWQERGGTTLLEAAKQSQE